MRNLRAAEMMRKLAESGGPLDYGPDHSRLLIRLWRTLAKGHPVSAEQVERTFAELGIDGGAAHEFLGQVAERDAADNIVGISGLSLNDHPHRFSVNGKRMSAWCAEDTLWLPAMLGQTATVESESPLSKDTVRLRVSPDGVEEVSPPGAVVSMVIVDPDEADLGSVEAIWGTFCHHIFFFASREEAERWAAGRDEIEILPVEEGHELAKQLWRNVVAYAA
jgi:alkylmercury lyase